jgi:hypothetical protein
VCWGNSYWTELDGVGWSLSCVGWRWKRWRWSRSLYSIAILQKRQLNV